MRRIALFGAFAVLVLATAVLVSMYRDLRRERQPPPRLIELPSFELTNRDGSTVTLDRLRGAPWVADFIFTRCALYCPRLTSRMKMLEESVPSAEGLTRVSITVDPAFDSPEVLSAYADSHGVDDERWLFLTGELEPVRTLIVGGFKLAVEDTVPILHSNRFVLVDAEGTVRGYYDATDGSEMERLIDDLRALL